MDTSYAWSLNPLRPRALPERECQSAEQEKEHVSHEPLFEGHNITFHQFGLILSAVFGSIAVIVAFFLIWRHASHYQKPNEQRYIIRILLMIPIYAVVSFLSYLNYKHAIYYEIIRDCYEAFAISSFFTLMCNYIAPTLHEQKQYFRTIEPKNWVWPLNWVQKCSGGQDKGFMRKPRSGLTWFNIVWISIFQYCFIRPFFTVVAVITQAFELYCQSSKDPRYAYIWVAAFDAISVTIAMYCLIQFYIQLKTDLAPHRPFLKVLCIKLVIFFCFWQSWIISLLTTSSGPLKPTKQVAGPDWRIGLPSMLVCFEMSIFAVLHLFAFPWKPYDLGKQGFASDGFSSEGGGGGGAKVKYAHGPLRAIASAFNPWDIIKGFGRGLRWLFVGVRHRQKDISYQTKLNSNEGGGTGYPQGPTFAGNGEEATELSRPTRNPAATSNSTTTTAGKHGGRRTGYDDSDDTAGLLSNSQPSPYGYQESHSALNVYSRPGDPDSLPSAPTPGQEYGPPSPAFKDYDVGYHGAAGGHADADADARLGPPQYRPVEAHSPGWDMFAGATRPGNSRPYDNNDDLRKI